MMTKRNRGRCAAAALMGAALSTAAVAADVAAPAATTATTASAAANTAPTGAAAGLRAFRDPQTGELRAPTPEELQAILEEERAMRAARGEREPTGPVAPLTIRRHPNGMRSAVLGPEYLISLRANRTPDGKVTISHDRPGHEHSAAPTQRPTE